MSQSELPFLVRDHQVVTYNCRTVGAWNKNSFRQTSGGETYTLKDMLGVSTSLHKARLCTDRFHALMTVRVCVNICPSVRSATARRAIMTRTVQDGALRAAYRGRSSSLYTEVGYCTQSAAIGPLL